MGYHYDYSLGQSSTESILIFRHTTQCGTADRLKAAAFVSKPANTETQPDAWFAILAAPPAANWLKLKTYKNVVGRRCHRPVCDEISGPSQSLERLKTFAPTKSADCERGAS